MISIRINKEVRIRRAKPEIPEWWVAVPQGEKALLHEVARVLRSAKHSQWEEVARAAAKWESGISFFIKVRLMNRKPRRLLADTGLVRVESKPAHSSSPAGPKPPVAPKRSDGGGEGRSSIPMQPSISS